MTPEDVARVLEEAREWIGTPYHHAADKKGVGVDCAMLPVRVYCDLGIVPQFDPRPYPHDWMLHRDDERYLGWVKQFAERVDDAQPGDLALYRVGRCLAHGGIVETPETIIHADLRAGRVERGPLRWCDRLAGVWRIP